MLSYCRFSLSHFKFIFKNSLSLRGISYRCEWSVTLHLWYLRHFPQYLLQMEAKQVSLHILGRVVASLVQAAESKSSQPNEPTTQNTKPVLLWTSKHKHIGVSQYLLFQTFHHNISFINRQVQATLVSENKTYQNIFSWILANL